jgi:hypothetical protein
MFRNLFLVQFCEILISMQNVCCAITVLFSHHEFPDKWASQRFEGKIAKNISYPSNPQNKSCFIIWRLLSYIFTPKLSMYFSSNIHRKLEEQKRMVHKRWKPKFWFFANTIWYVHKCRPQSQHFNFNFNDVT